MAGWQKQEKGDGENDTKLRVAKENVAAGDRVEVANEIKESRGSKELMKRPNNTRDKLGWVSVQC